MGKLHASLFHPSQVFTDTQKVDLFNDPRWDAIQVLGQRRRFRLAEVPGIRSLVKRGRHSRAAS